MTVKRINTKRGVRHVKVLANGQYRFISKVDYDKAKGKKPSTKNPSSSSKGGSASKMGKRKYKIPIAATAGALGGLVIPPHGSGGVSPLKAAQAGDWDTAGKHLFVNYTGIDPDTGNFHPGTQGKGIKAMIIGATISMLASNLGLNRYLRGIPWFSI